MNTIDYIAKGQKVQFSKKAVNINGKDYAYTGMTAIKHSSAKHLYLFKYEDSWRMLPYNPEDEQKLKVLFSRIAELNAKRAKIRDAANAPVHVEPPQAPKIDVKSIMETAEEAPAEEIPVEVVPEAVEEPVPEVVEEPTPEVIEEPTEIVEEPVPEVVEETIPEVVEETVPEVTEKPVEVPEAAEEVSAEPSEETPETPTEEAPVEETPAEEAEEQAEGIFPPEEKKAKLKKSFKVLAAIIAAFIILAVVYFFVAGTTNNPTVGPNADETQQYEDIDGLIEDLQDDN